MIYHRRRALVITAAYLLVGVAWIMISGKVASTIAPDVLELAHIEKIKGILYVLLSALGIFLFAQWQLRDVAREATDLLDHRDALLVSERRVIAGTIVAGGAHVVKGGINKALTALEKLRSMISAPDALREVDRSIEALSGLLSGMQRIRDSGLSEIAGSEQRVDLCKLLESSIEIARLHAIVRHCDIRFTGCKEFNAFVFPGLVHSALVNLLVNAAEATGGRGKIEIHFRSDATEVALEVHDNGPGILSSERETVFAPFYSTKKQRAGLGLLAVHACAEAHGGRAEVLTSHLGGARFDLVFPGSVQTG